MKTVFIFLPYLFVFFLFVVLLLVLRRFFIQMMIRNSQIQEVPKTVEWNHLNAMSIEIAKRKRVVCPILMAIPEMTVNAMVLPRGKSGVIAVTEGCLHTLDEDELKTLLELCFERVQFRIGLVQRVLLILFIPIFTFIEKVPSIVRLIFYPSLLLVMKLLWSREEEFQMDQKVSQIVGPFKYAKLLQKIAFLHRNIPLRNWTFGSSFFWVVSPQEFSGVGVSYSFALVRPKITERRNRILASPACESGAFCNNN
ncbi:MAG: hypothetical protein M9962_09155 [Oligoflexia bacterium]|nr:hypothetical protein [Oligoflexia bacterium]